MDFGIAGKRALVLGGSKGLGAAIAQALAAEGVEVVAASRSAAENTPAASGKGSIRGMAVDLSDAASVANLAEAVLADGGVDILVNNSGGPAAGPAGGNSAEKWEAAFAAMATSLFSLTDRMLPGMIDRKWGRIVTVGSSGVIQPIPNLGLSNGVRGAIAGWSKTLAGEVAAHGITVNMVLPGRIDTDRVRSLDRTKAEKSGQGVDAVAAASQREIPVGRYGRPEEFGAVVAFLASTQASYVTGSMIRIDGGLIRSL